MTARHGLILEAVDVLVERLLEVDREDDDYLHPGDIEAAIVAGEILARHMEDRFAMVLRTTLRQNLAEYGIEP